MTNTPSNGLTTRNGRNRPSLPPRSQDQADTESGEITAIGRTSARFPFFFTSTCENPSDERSSGGHARRELAELDGAPSTPEMYEWEERGHDYGYCAAGACTVRQDLEAVSEEIPKGMLLPLVAPGSGFVGPSMKARIPLFTGSWPGFVALLVLHTAVTSACTTRESTASRSGRTRCPASRRSGCGSSRSC